MFILVSHKKQLDMKVVHIKGEVNEVCDALSRLNNPNSGDRITLLDRGKFMCCNTIFLCPFQS